MTRREIINIELDKYFENWKDNISLLIKYEYKKGNINNDEETTLREIHLEWLIKCLEDKAKD